MNRVQRSNIGDRTRQSRTRQSNLRLAWLLTLLALSFYLAVILTRVIS